MASVQGAQYKVEVALLPFWSSKPAYLSSLINLCGQLLHCFHSVALFSAYKSQSKCISFGFDLTEDVHQSTNYDLFSISRVSETHIKCSVYAQTTTRSCYMSLLKRTPVAIRLTNIDLKATTQVPNSIAFQILPDVYTAWWFLVSLTIWTYMKQYIVIIEMQLLQPHHKRVDWTLQDMKLHWVETCTLSKKLKDCTISNTLSTWH